MLTTALLTVVLCVIVAPLATLIIYILNCVKNYIAFQRLQRLHNKNGKVLKRAPAHYGLGLLMVYIDTKNTFKELLNWATSDINSEGIFETMNSGFIQLSVSDPEMLKKITIKENARFPKSKPTYELLQPVLGLGLVTASGPLWQRHRRLIGPLFTEKSIQLMTSKMIRYAIAERDSIYSVAPQGFDFGKFASKLTLQIISSCAFGLEEDSQNVLEYLSDRWVQLFDMFASFGISGGYLLFGLGYKRFRVGPNAKFLGLMKDIESKVEEIIEQRRKFLETDSTTTSTTTSEEEYSDLLTLLISARDENGNGLSMQEIIDESHTFLFAGHETTSSLLSWMFYLFCIHKDTQHRVIEEVDDFFNSGKNLSFDTVQSLKYLNQVVSETLRLYPPVTNVDRCASQDCYLGDYFVPKGTEITLNFLGLHRSEKFWRNANSFDPDRWTDKNLAESLGRQSGYFMPFSKGSRDCIGKKFAVVEASIIVVLILQRFEVCFADGCSEGSIGTDMTTILKPTNLTVVFKERVKGG